MFVQRHQLSQTQAEETLSTNTSHPDKRCKVAYQLVEARGRADAEHSKSEEGAHTCKQAVLALRGRRLFPDAFSRPLVGDTISTGTPTTMPEDPPKDSPHTSAATPTRPQTHNTKHKTPQSSLSRGTLARSHSSHPAERSTAHFPAAQRP
ncbi:uncharacterized protein MONOS_7262 [Monocercomonoides exilis]|uniref:uncharacterized protein n=1 Tax=Monocercomonoides exilis TaxID=2049356 RepID=UPI00355A9697|nr:hypothetical protein MONOS_7262 [Monocercomonoides exilis]|eukprot:MONOS_7262.1-p1 / transcript=MONOS_7262.1 / gene=MONOS_7262 / organism=Monocercomonoides_exilis_PA203 / gene_product=unspecified product / transcript_product=unspecified product / location=Mono_scaffold00244:16848-17297(-) / protein_length=150 / sequence_SO=supercontig / SO=protein_coding / is_pseudo=false